MLTAVLGSKQQVGNNDYSRKQQRQARKDAKPDRSKRLEARQLKDKMISLGKWDEV